MLVALDDADRHIARAIDGIMQLQDTGEAELTTGVGLDQWISLIARRTGSDTRMLLTTTRVLRRLPSLHAALSEHTISWAQTRAVVLAVDRVPRQLDDRLDAALADAVRDTVDAHPDGLAQVVRWVLADLDPSDATDPASDDTAQFLAMQPRLDGSGGRLYGDLGPLAWATADAALNTGLQPPHGTRDGFGRQRDPARAREAARTMGRRRLDRLVEILDASLEDPPPHLPATPTGSPGDASPGDAETSEGSTDDAQAADVGIPSPPQAGSRRGSRPQLLLRANLSSLLDRDTVPADLLTTLLGGRVRLTSHAARDLLDARGADLRTVVLDDGEVVGVGRATRVPPGWLRDVVLALHDTCSAPGCDLAARVCDIDHARPWHPARPDDRPGRTDIDNLGPLCRTDNRTKERDGWRSEQTARGERTWRHDRSGITVRTLPTNPPLNDPPSGSRTTPRPRGLAEAPPGPAPPPASDPPTGARGGPLPF